MEKGHVIEPMTYSDFEQLLADPRRGKYYVGRWEYFKHVIDFVHEIKPESVLELGPGHHTVVKGCDVMICPEDDQWGLPVNAIGKVYVHNATEKPWPVGDKEYDLFIALQVWEHLDNKQNRAFREVLRVAKAAVLSFPYMWDCPKDDPNYPEHHLIDRDLINDWTLNVPPVRVVEIARTGEHVTKGPRLVYFWQFED